jgi:hypothetical protein
VLVGMKVSASRGNVSHGDTSKLFGNTPKLSLPNVSSNGYADEVIPLCMGKT